MKVLFTGASSFTGYWFATELATAGQDIIATLTRSDIESYREVRGERVKRVVEHCQPVFACRFGDDKFLDLLKKEKFDLLCHHGADATDYKSPDFDVCQAVSNNTHRIQEVLKALSSNGQAAVLLTGSVFEAGEGAGSDDLIAFSPYGLSKSITADIFAYYARVLGVRLAKFVIPNPFGPWEEARFTAYLMRTWASGGVAAVRTPDYIRDNVHVSLLAKSYVQFAERSPSAVGFRRLNPSGYVESQGAFAERVARETRDRTGWKCELQHATQTLFDEPRQRINTEPVDGSIFGWNEVGAWDEFTKWYASRLS